MSHDVGFFGLLARELHGFTGHGTDVLGASIDGRTLATMTRGLRGRRFPLADAVLLELPDQITARDWSDAGADFRCALRRLSTQMPDRAQLVVLKPRLLPAGVQESLELLIAALPRTSRLVRLPQELEPGQVRYRQWSSLLAAPIASALHDPFHWSDPSSDSGGRPQVDELRHVSSESPRLRAALQGLVRKAAASYGTSSAAVSVIDRFDTHYISTHGSIAPHSMARAGSVCSTVIDRYAGLIVGNARLDTRLSTVPVVSDGTVVFYAGYRILDPSSVPVGVLCVFDSNPRPVLSQDIDVLRDIAAAVECEIWS